MFNRKKNDGEKSHVMDGITIEDGTQGPHLELLEAARKDHRSISVRFNFHGLEVELDTGYRMAELSYYLMALFSESARQLKSKRNIANEKAIAVISAYLKAHFTEQYFDLERSSLEVATGIADSFYGVYESQDSFVAQKMMNEISSIRDLSSAAHSTIHENLNVEQFTTWLMKNYYSQDNHYFEGTTNA